MNFANKFFGKFLFKREALAKSWGEYFAWLPARVFCLATVAVNLLLWLGAWLIQRGLNQDLAILHYTITIGIDYLAPRAQIFYLPLIGLVLFLLNGCLSFIWFKKDKFLVNLLLAAALAVNVLVGLALYSIYLVNFVKIF
jgi:hypothetical protein